MLVGWIIHVHPIKFLFRIVLGEPPPILAISGNNVLWFLDSPGFNIVKSLNINRVGVPSFSVGVGMCFSTSSSLKNFKDRIFSPYNLDIWVVSARILASLRSVLVHSFSTTMLLYLSVASWMSTPYGTSLPMYQSSLVLSVKLLKV